MVGEKGTGKTTLINAMVNCMLGVKREDKVWFEITDDQSDRTSAHSQTSIITVYGFYLQEGQWNCIFHCYKHMFLLNHLSVLSSMDPVGVNSIETAALGRPFQLGMLYDCRRDALVPGIRLWSKEQLQQNINTKPQINTVFAVTASDSAEDKSRLLDIDGCLKLSFLGGLINVSGAANFLKDTKKSFNQQRLTLHYHSTTKFEELIMNHFPSGEMAHDNDVATHVVTAVLYGADACFVFDREVSSDEDKRVIAGEVKAVFGKLKGISAGANINLNDNQRTAAQKFSCTFYGDFQLPCNPTSFEDAMKVFEDLPKLLGENKELAIPLKVWLYPLDRLFSRVVKFQHEISIGLSTDIESVIEHLSTTEMKCSDLLTDTPALTFTAFHDKINEMKKNCYQCRLSLMKKLGSLLPKIRGKFIEETALIDLLNDHKESPFESSLAQWLEMKEEESDIIKSLFTQLNDSGAMVEKLNKNLMHLKVTHVVIYMFTSLGWPDVLLSKQKAYLSSVKENEDKSSESEHKTWLTSEIQKTMRNNLEVFKKLIDLNVSKSVKFIVASKEMENSPGSCILLYENGCNEAVRFTPPSKPDCPVIEDVRCRQVILKVSPPCPATEELKLLYKMKEEKDWTSQTVSKNQNTVTLTDLRPDTEYSIKCAAVGKLNYTVDSDVTRLTVINQNLIKAKESATENLCWTENKCSVLLGNTKETTFTALYKKIQGMQQNCQMYRQDFSDRIKSVIQSVKSCEKVSSALLDLLQAHDESPFNEKSLKEWITVKEEELNTVNDFLRQLLDLGAEVNRSLDSYLSDIQLENVFCYTFSSLEEPDELLNEQEKYMNTQFLRNPQKIPDAASQSWLTGSIREKMREHLKIFKELMTSNSSQSTKFMVSIKHHKKHPGSCILLYKNGCNEAVCFTSPSKPDCPVIEDVRCRQVDLKVSPPCPATEELKLLYKMKEEKDWTSQTMSKNQNTVTLTDLRPDTQYSIKCAAVGKLNYITESDVTTVITKDKNKLIMKTILIKDGNPARYRLQTRTDNLCQSETYRKITFGERSKNKPHKTILLVGETGTGKTTLIDTMINYMLDVKRKDKVWFEITDDQSDRTQQHTQTTIITVYEFYLQESPIDLTIIDTPGYGNTDGVEFDKQIAVSLLSLSKSTKGIHEIDAVCLVIYATQNRLSYRTMYIFDAVQSLFGRDIAENIVLLFTRSDGAPPKNALTAVKEAQIKCAVNYKNQPVFFLFDNCQSDEADEEYEITQKQSWYRSFRGMTGLFEFLDTIKPKSLVMTRDVLQQQKQLEAAVSNLHLHVQMMGLKQNELKQTQEVLEQNKEHVKDNKNFEYEVKVPYKEKVDIDHSKAKMATCCTVCEENCVYPDSGWVRNRSWFNAMKNDHCTVCTNKCHYSKHVKGAKIYVTKTKIEKRTYEDLKKKYVDKIGDGVFVAKKLEEELQELEKEKIKLVNEAFDCVEMLQKITLNIDSLIILQHIDFLTEKLKEVNEPEKAQTLENIKKTAGKEKHGALEYFFKNKLK
ncbi:stonustoxin subunit beta-like protein [Labeo rohita]|uniref:Stonustoxin subunit beta-like protein n=1 Tax=Labeo rohita TaxID=84645 RepID=A0A498NFV8_LABRO|nr:stonustoxin subunit beta-like protein [Labeo rohita]